MARELGNRPFGKNESFYTLQAPTSGWMYNGCKAHSAEEMKSRLESGRIAETLDTMPCHAGDYVYINSGVLHAATAGSLHFEIEENCEITYRFYDFERKDHHGHLRPLQIENALRCLDVTKKSQARTYGEYPIEERMYSTQLIRQRNRFANSGGTFAFAVMLRGDREFDGYRVTPGTAILLDSDESLDVSGGEFMVCKPKPYILLRTI
jgi:mannose-6-phosphate isomerase class I